MSEYRFKEVYFDNFCALCKHKDLDEAEDPCDECLSEPVNEYSHKPVNFIAEEKTNGSK